MACPGEAYVHPSLFRLDPKRSAELELRLAKTLETSGDELDLSSLDLSSVPVVACSRPLVQLTLRMNCFYQFPSEITSLAALRVLDLSHNRIEVLPAEISQLQSLRDLNLMTNHLRRLERSIPLQALASLAHLECLDVRYNKKLMRESLGEVLTANVPPGCRVLFGAPPKPEQQSPGERDATSLRSQLEPWGTPTLRRRLAETFGIETEPDLGREGVFDLLLEAYAARGPRAHRKVSGREFPPSSSHLLVELLKELRSTAFPEEDKRERQNVRAQGYIVLRKFPTVTCDSVAGARSAAGSDDESGSGVRPDEWKRQPGARTIRPVPKPSSKMVWSRRKNAGKLQQHIRAWDLARELVESVDPDFAKRYSAIALTKNFEGSPHIDLENWGPFCGISVGDFEGGGVCVESTPFEIVEVETHDKLGKIDGRFPHWVAPYTGERYSVIYYQTEGPEVPKTTAWLEH